MPGFNMPKLDLAYKPHPATSLGQSSTPAKPCPLHHIYPRHISLYKAYTIKYYDIKVQQYNNNFMFGMYES